MVTVPAWSAIAASVRGASHERIGQKNQDAVRWRNPEGKDDFLLLAVSDGHGSTRSFRSDRGSAIATEVAVRELSRFIRRLGSGASLSSVRRQARSRWPRQMIDAWKAAVRAELQVNPFSPLDFAAFPEPPPVLKPGEDLPTLAYLAYGATLVTVAVTPRFIFFSQLGDGDILTVWPDGRVERPLPRQHEFMANQTTSLCTPFAYLKFQIRVMPNRAGAPSLIMLSTDGYANCFGNDDGFFAVGADLFAYLKEQGPGFVNEHLGHWLRESSRDGSGDDITVGLASRCGFVPVPQNGNET